MNEATRAGPLAKLDELAVLDPEVLPESTSPDYAFRYLDISAVSTGRIELPSELTAFSDAPSRARMVVRPGDVLMSTVRPGLKAFARYCGDNENVVASTGFAVLRAKHCADGQFLFNALLSDGVTAQIEQAAVGSNYPAINGRDVKRLTVPRLPLRTQQRIAAILTSLDNAIEATEALIEKHQQIKAGLMLDLFTRGVSDDEHLRPRPMEAMNLYQQTKQLGPLPKDWRVAKLGDLVNPARPIVYGILMPGYGFPGGVPVVKVKDIRDRRIAFEDLLLTSPQIDNEYRRSRLRAGDVLFTIRGTVGRVAVVPSELEGANITQDTARMDLIGVSGDFASYYFETPMAKRFFEVNTLGVAVQGINLGELRKLPVPVPRPAEQEHIVATLTTAYRRIDSENAVLQKLRAQKQGLMQDLLIGKVSVRTD
jgi:type I restriction enzyme, S subunit